MYYNFELKFRKKCEILAKNYLRIDTVNKNLQKIFFVLKTFFDIKNFKFLVIRSVY